MDESLRDFLDVNDFAVEVLADDGRTFTAIFDDVGIAATIGPVELEDRKPQMVVIDSDAAPFEWGRSEVVIKGETFRIVRVLPDGSGTSIVELSR